MYGRILVPVDGSEAANRGLKEAIGMAQELRATLRLVHAVNEVVFDSGYSPTMYLDQLVELMREAGRTILRNAEALARTQGAEPQTALLESIGASAADIIVEQARQWPADLIVMGTHGRRGLRRLVMGSDAEAVLRLSPVPVLMVRSDSQTP